MKTKWDYNYLIDQLSNSMEFYASKEDFVSQLSAETKFSPEELNTIWDKYSLIDGKTAFDMDTQDWIYWLNQLI